MSIAFTMQKFQDWFTQQWVILFGRKIQPEDFPWLMGPFGELNGIGELFIDQLAKKEKLSVRRNCSNVGLLQHINLLQLTKEELDALPKNVIDFYEKTANYQLDFQVKWHPLFKVLGTVVNRLFSQRINQLNIPTSNRSDRAALTSEIIQLLDPMTQEIRYTIWLRKFVSDGKIIYSGMYGICTLPSGETCIKAVFPLPKGNATVILKPSVDKNKAFILTSKGKRFGDAGFYFLLNDAKNNCWAQYISSFTDQLIVYEEDGLLFAQQSLKLWKLHVATFFYSIHA